MREAGDTAQEVPPDDNNLTEALQQQLQVEDPGAEEAKLVEPNQQPQDAAVEKKPEGRRVPKISILRVMQLAPHNPDRRILVLLDGLPELVAGKPDQPAQANQPPLEIGYAQPIRHYGDGVSVLPIHFDDGKYVHYKLTFVKDFLESMEPDTVLERGCRKCAVHGTSNKAKHPKCENALCRCRKCHEIDLDNSEARGKYAGEKAELGQSPTDKEQQRASEYEEETKEKQKQCRKECGTLCDEMIPGRPSLCNECRRPLMLARYMNGWRIGQNKRRNKERKANELAAKQAAHK